MKKLNLIFLLLCMVVVVQAAAIDSTKIKRGWNFGPFPAVGYNSDLGFQYGALCDFYYYGDGSRFPQYIHKFNAEVSAYTKGSIQLHAFYDSKFLIPNLRVTMAATYISDAMNDFYGFNGYAAPYADTLHNGYYRIKRDMLRIVADFQGKIVGNLGWAFGAGYWSNTIGSVTLKEYRDLPSLYKEYVANGIIRSEEQNGGQHLEFKAGLVYDTRDHEADPERGLCLEAILYGSPDMIEQRGNSYLNLSLVFRQYIPLASRLTAAYRVAYQGCLAGNLPFYMQQNIALLYLRRVRSEGLGGATTLRGVLRNRIAADGFAWANVELRYRFLDFKLFNQNFYLVLNPFFDAGMTVQPYRLSAMKATENAAIYSGSKESLHCSAGIGAKAIMNRNFTLSAEWGKTFDNRDGKSGLNIGLNYIF